MANTVSRLTANGNLFITGQFDEVTYNTSVLNTNKQFNGPMVNLCRSSNDMTLVGTVPASTTTPWYYGSTSPVFVNRAVSVLDPFGGYNAFKVGGQLNSVSNFYALNMDARSFFNSGNGSGGNNLYLKAGATYCYSIYAKAAEYGYVRLGPYDALPAGEGSGGSWEIQFNIVTGTASTPNSYETSGVINAGNGWWRIWITRTIQDTTSTGNPGSFDIIPNPANSGSYIPDGKSGCYLYGMQVELGSYPSKYIPTDLNGPINSGVSKIDSSGNQYVIKGLDEVTYNKTNPTYVNLLSWSSDLSNTTVWPTGSGNVYIPLSNPTTPGPFTGTTAYKFISKPLGINVGDGPYYWEMTQPYSVWAITPLTASTPYNPASGSLTVVPGAIPAGSVATLSMYFKPAEFTNFSIAFYDTQAATKGVNISNVANNPTFQNADSGTNSGVIPVGNGWYRCWVSRRVTGSVTGIYIEPYGSAGYNYITDEKSGAYIWGPQLEITPSIFSGPSAYVPTGYRGVPINTAASKLDGFGNYSVSGSFDEYTKGMNIITNGLIYNMDPSKPESWTGSNAIYDSTKTNPQGSIVGSYNYNIDGGGTIALDGLTAYANTGILGNTAPFQTTSEFTMSIWCKFTGPTKTTSGTSTLFGAFNFQGFGICWSPGTNNLPGAIYSVVRPNNGIEYGSYTSNAADFQLNRWYNYVFTYSGSNLANTSFLYVNSSKAPSGAQYGSNLPYSTNMNGIYITIGNILPESGGPSGYFPGRIGQALIYNRALSASEIAQNFQEMRSQYGV